MLEEKADLKAIRLWYKLNENTRIQVETGAGMSERGEVGAVLGQGTLGSAIISQAVLDEAVMALWIWLRVCFKMTWPMGRLGSWQPGWPTIRWIFL